jgi:hypothetical protein
MYLKCLLDICVYVGSLDLFDCIGGFGSADEKLEVPP